MTAVYILLGIIGFFVFLQVSARRMANKSKGAKLTGLQGELKKLENKGVKGLVYFYSPGCHACKSVTPIIREMKQNHKNIFDIDISRERSALQAFGIRATPTTMLVENGVITEVMLGARSKQAFEKLVTW